MASCSQLSSLDPRSECSRPQTSPRMASPGSFRTCSPGPRCIIWMRKAVRGVRYMMRVWRFHRLPQDLVSWHTSKEHKESDARFKNRIAPSRHSGLSSLSPNDPRSSLTRMSACSGISMLRMSPKSNITAFPHSLCWRCWSLLVEGRQDDAKKYIRIEGGVRDICVGILLYGIHYRFTMRAFDSCETSSNKRAAASTCNTEYTV